MCDMVNGLVCGRTLHEFARRLHLDRFLAVNALQALEARHLCPLPCILRSMRLCAAPGRCMLRPAPEQTCVCAHDIRRRPPCPEVRSMRVQACLLLATDAHQPGHA